MVGLHAYMHVMLQGKDAPRLMRRLSFKNSCILVPIKCSRPVLTTQLRHHQAFAFSYQCLSQLQLFLMVKLLYKTRSPFLGSQNALPVSEKTKESQMLDQRRLPRVNVEAFLRELGCNDGSP